MVTCTFAFACSKRWTDLSRTATASVGYCQDCSQQVFQVRSAAELAVAVALRRCIAIPRGDEGVEPTPDGLGSVSVTQPGSGSAGRSAGQRTLGPEWELGLPAPPHNEEELSRPTPVYVRLPMPLPSGRREQLRLALPALFDSGRGEATMARGDTFRLTVLPRAHAEPLIAELKRVASELLVFSDS